MNGSSYETSSYETNYSSHELEDDYPTDSGNFSSYEYYEDNATIYEPNPIDHDFEFLYNFNIFIQPLGLILNLIVLAISLLQSDCKAIKYHHFAICLSIADIFCTTFQSFEALAFKTSVAYLFVNISGTPVELGFFFTPFRYFFMWISLTSLIPALLNRYIAIKHPTKYDRYFSPKLIYFYLFLAIFIPLIFNTLSFSAVLAYELIGNKVKYLHKL